MSSTRDELNRRGAALGDRFDDLVQFLVVTALKTAERYDPSRVKPGYSFSSYIYDVLAMRTTDFFRAKSNGFADRRYNPDGSPVVLMGGKIETLEAAYGSREYEADEDFGEAADELGEGLSPDARWTLETIGRALAEGATISQAAEDAGVSVWRARRKFGELREELEAARVG